jgi:hypothetical protein
MTCQVQLIFVNMVSGHLNPNEAVVGPTQCSGLVISPISLGLPKTKWTLIRAAPTDELTFTGIDFKQLQPH